MHSNSISDLLSRGVACLEKGQFSDATEWFTKATSADPGSFMAHARLGMTLMQLECYEKAIEVFMRALEIKRVAPVVAHNLGKCYTETNRLELAGRYLRLAIEFRPNYTEALIDLGNVCQKQGNNSKALGYHRKALTIDPSSFVAQHNIGLCLYNDRNLKRAEDAFRLAVKMNPGNSLGVCFLGVILEHQGKYDDAKTFLHIARQGSRFNQCLIESARYAFERGAKARFFSNTADLLRHAVGESSHDGLFLELGVYYGDSLSVIAESTDNIVYGFDSFEGLPESWFVGEEKGSTATEDSGSYSTKGTLPNGPENTILHAGWFEDTLPVFVEENDESVSFMNIDCDIYSSTKTIFEHLKDRIRPGTIIVFDEYFCYPEWRDHEYKAFQEFISDSPFSYEYIAFSYFTAQATVRIL